MASGYIYLDGKMLFMFFTILPYSFYKYKSNSAVQPM